METSSSHDSDSSTNSNTSIHLPYSSNSNSYDDDDNDYQQDKDIFMLHSRSVSYTSLKDLLHESQTSIMSPSATRNNSTGNSSFYEIPIKNHLVKQAALAYLSPMSSPKPAGSSRWFERMMDMLFGCGCFQ